MSSPQISVDRDDDVFPEPVTHYKICSADFILGKQYTPIKAVGSGAYGIVCSAKLQTGATSRDVAIKRVAHAFQNAEDAKRLLREIKLLKHFKHENIIRILDITMPRTWLEFDDVYIVSELMDTDLNQIIRSDQPLSDDHVQYFIYQILRALKYIHSANVLHRDLKPSNILINANCEAKVCDFGLSRPIGGPDLQFKHLTLYVTTRWYRAPEILLCDTYSKPIDIWSAGCILAELLGRKPLFTGKNYWQQLHVITSVLGTPDDSEIAHITNPRARHFIRQAPFAHKIDFRKVYPNANPQAMNLLSRMLEFDPSRRCTVEEALAHPYLSSLHDPNDEPDCKDHFLFDFEMEKLTGPIVKELVFKEMAEFHPSPNKQIQLKNMWDIAHEERLAQEARGDDTMGDKQATEDHRTQQQQQQQQQQQLQQQQQQQNEGLQAQQRQGDVIDVMMEGMEEDKPKPVPSDARLDG
eukprot:TRINITY_DN905_c1_g6_i1.p1 TRINITY_DN905_c1_g6~~TRINITY_DN905_c1_g6_i1.p1  ORF type:complete len:479 (+),score=141.71 TRINITY_DN905_c1_g6_i1:37-1437(+)